MACAFEATDRRAPLSQPQPLIPNKATRSPSTHLWWQSRPAQSRKASANENLIPFSSDVTPNIKAKAQTANNTHLGSVSRVWRRSDELSSARWLLLHGLHLSIPGTDRDRGKRKVACTTSLGASFGSELAAVARGSAVSPAVGAAFLSLGQQTRGQRAFTGDAECILAFRIPRL